MNICRKNNITLLIFLLRCVLFLYDTDFVSGSEWDTSKDDGSKNAFYNFHISNIPNGKSQRNSKTHLTSLNQDHSYYQNNQKLWIEDLSNFSINEPINDIPNSNPNSNIVYRDPELHNQEIMEKVDSYYYNNLDDIFVENLTEPNKIQDFALYEDEKHISDDAFVNTFLKNILTEERLSKINEDNSSNVIENNVNDFLEGSTLTTITEEADVIKENKEISKDTEIKQVTETNNDNISTMVHDTIEKNSSQEFPMNENISSEKMNMFHAANPMMFDLNLPILKIITVDSIAENSILTQGPMQWERTSDVHSKDQSTDTNFCSQSNSIWKKRKSIDSENSMNILSAKRKNTRENEDDNYALDDEELLEGQEVENDEEEYPKYEGVNNDFFSLEEISNNPYNYASFFKCVIPYLDFIHLTFQQTNMEDSSKLFNSIHFLKKNIPLLKNINYVLIKYKKDRSNQCLRNMIRKIDGLKSYLKEVEPLEDPIDMLDTSIIIKTYLFLVSVFSLKYTVGQRRYIKSVTDIQQKILKQLPISGEQLSLNLDKLKEVFSMLVIRPAIRAPMYKMRHYFRDVFRICRETDFSVNEKFDTPVNYIIQKTIELSDALSNSYNPLNYRSPVFLLETVKGVYDNSKVSVIERINEFLLYIEEQQTEVKNKIKSTLKNPIAVGTYLFHLLSSLMIQRLITTLNKSEESETCSSLYKTLMNDCALMLSKYMDFPQFNKLNNNDKTCIYENEELIDSLILYFHLNLVKITFLEINEKNKSHSEFLKTLEQLQIRFVRENNLLKVKSFYKDSIDLMDDLIRVFKLIRKNKSILQSYVHSYMVSEEVHGKVTGIFNLLNNLQNGRIKEEDVQKIRSEYDEIISLQHKYISFFNNLLLNVK